MSIGRTALLIPPSLSPTSRAPRGGPISGFPTAARGRSSHRRIELAVAIVVILLLATLPALGGLGHAAAAATPLSRPASEVDPSVAGVVAPTALVPAAAGGACLATNGSGGAPSGNRVSPPPPSGTTGPSPLFNSQVVPYASLTGPYAYVAAGAALRDQGYGLINLTWPGSPSTSNLAGAYMIWSILNDSAPPTSAALNGVALNGTWTAYATPSPCWAPTYIYTFIADVTNEVVNGVNNVTNVPTSISSGVNPWSTPQNDLLDEGASLVAIYEPSTPTTIHQVTVYTGALPVTGTGPVATLNYSVTNASSAVTTYIVADGQDPGNSATWNKSVIDSNAFPGDDAKESRAAWLYGNLSDTRTFDVSVRVGSNNTTAQVSTGGSDCVTWVGQVLSVGVPALKGPYTVDFSEQGLPNGTSWNVTTHATTKSGTVVADASTIHFSLANATYTYSVGAVAGYVSTYTGSFHVLGGPVYLRVIFHELLYPVTFNESGLPSYAAWWVKLTNSSQGLSDNLTAYTPTGFVFYEPNGTYRYTTGETGLYSASPAAGTLSVLTAGASVIVPFLPPPLYNVTFQEVGLPVGTHWGASYSTNWVNSYALTSNASFSVLLPNTTTSSDTVDPYAVSGYQAPYYVYFTVKGAPETVDLNYTELFGVKFIETGLAAGAYWSGTLVNTLGGSSYGGSNTPDMNYSVVNGSYTYTINPIWSYTATPSTGPVTVAGANVTVRIVFAPSPLYSLTFNETGLAPGSLWTVGLLLPNDTELRHNSSGRSLVYAEPNGTYDYYPVAAGYAAAPVDGYVPLSGANVSVSIVFTKVYSVTFNETGLPSGTYWDVDFNYTFGGSYSPSIVFWVSNGTLPFTAYDEGSYAPTPTSGSIDVHGANQVENIAYASPTSPTVAVTFEEIGLAPDTNWSVDMNGYLAYSTGTALNFTEANGSFDYSVSTGAAYTPYPAYGTLTVAGRPVVQDIDFSSTTGTYSVTFTESGLPTGVIWYVNITGRPGLSATVSGASGTTVVAQLANGSYTFSAATNDPDWLPPSPGDFTVAGVALDEPVPFTSTTTAQYLVTFTETGLPTGSTWYVNITGEPGLDATVSSSSGTTLSTDLPDGSYAYTAATSAPAWTTPSPSEFRVAGGQLNEPVPFHSTSTAEYAVTFTESGLPTGATWYVNVTGQPGQSATVSNDGGTTISVELPDASYTYEASTSLTGWATPEHGAFTVAGAALNEPVPFTASSVPVYLVTFTESGLPGGATWYINISGQPSLSATVDGSTGTQVTINLPNGDYSYTAAANSKNWTAPAGTLTVSGVNVDRTVVFTTGGSSKATSSSSFPWVDVGAGILVLVLLAGFLIFLLGRRRKKKEAENAPPASSAPPAEKAP